ncbi:MAG: hypothetical protein NC218_08440 [Acetobacter sp.]|nr:hypothetical protein [Acetobacter sp.]
MNKKKSQIAYAISLEGNTDFEYNLVDELLVFDNLEQIAEYCNVNSINYEAVSVHEIEVAPYGIDGNDIEEIEF